MKLNITKNEAAFLRILIGCIPIHSDFSEELFSLAQKLDLEGLYSKTLPIKTPPAFSVKVDCVAYTQIFDFIKKIWKNHES